ncbi:MAG: hypothetical protein WA061_02585 [Microgenomates group bacterium]
MKSFVWHMAKEQPKDTWDSYLLWVSDGKVSFCWSVLQSWHPNAKRFYTGAYEYFDKYETLKIVKWCKVPSPSKIDFR